VTEEVLASFRSENDKFYKETNKVVEEKRQFFHSTRLLKERKLKMIERGIQKGIVERSFFRVFLFPIWILENIYKQKLDLLFSQDLQYNKC